MKYLACLEGEACNILLFRQRNEVMHGQDVSFGVIVGVCRVGRRCKPRQFIPVFVFTSKTGQSCRSLIHTSPSYEQPQDVQLYVCIQAANSIRARLYNGEIQHSEQDLPSTILLT